MSQPQSKNQLRLLTDTIQSMKQGKPSTTLSGKQIFFNPKQNFQPMQEYYPQYPLTARSKESSNSITKGASFLDERKKSTQQAISVVQQGITQMKLKSILKSSLLRQQLQKSVKSISVKSKEEPSSSIKRKKTSMLNYNNTLTQNQNIFQSIFVLNLKSQVKSTIQSPNKSPKAAPQNTNVSSKAAMHVPPNVSKEKDIAQNLNSPKMSPSKVRKQFSMSLMQSLANNVMKKTSPEVKLTNRPDLKLDLNYITNVNSEPLTERFVSNKAFCKFQPRSVRSKKLDNNQLEQTEKSIQKLDLELKINSSQKVTIQKSARSYKKDLQESLTILQSNHTERNISKEIEQKFVKCDSKLALLRHGFLLTQLETIEILDYDTIYCIGAQAIKIPNTDKSCNFGYDNDKGDFIFVMNDHIGYRYEMISKLGKGSFGQAFKVYDHKQGSYVAMKVIKNKKRFHAQALEEIQILKIVRDSCESIVNISDYFIFRNHVCIAFELLNLNLYDYLKQNNFQGLHLDLVRKFSIQLLQALLEMENKGVIHCDLKPENILLKEQNKCGIKVIDFGSSCLRGNKLYTYIQSRFYRAPEILLGLPYDTHIDLWSFGCILVELASGRPIFQSQNETDHVSMIIESFGKPPLTMIQKSTKRWMYFDEKVQPLNMQNTQGSPRFVGVRPLEYILSSYPPNFIEFVGGFLKWNPEQRCTPAEGLVHPWILEGLPNNIRTQHLQLMKVQAPYLRMFNDATQSQEIPLGTLLGIQVSDKHINQGIQGESKLNKKRSSYQ